MLKYAKITNDTTKSCDVGLGTNSEFYQSIGMTEQDVEQAYNGSWYLKGYSPEKPQPTEEELLEQAKSERAEEVKKITVTTKSGKTFDGDEDSQTRMARAILASEATGLNETLWVLANNSIEKVTVAELKEAFTKAGAKQTELWIKPYQAEKV